MVANSIIYHDNNFNLYRAYSYTLLLQVEESKFNYAIIHRNKLIELVQDCDLHELVRPDQLKNVLTASFSKIIIGLSASGLSLMPNALFSEDKAAGYARVLDVKPNEKVLVEPLDESNVIIFKTDEDLLSSVESYRPDNLVYCFSGWIQAIAKSNPPDHNLYLDIGKETVHFLYFLSGNLRFFNTFEFKSEEDLAYYTALVTDELRLKPHQISVIISGNADKGDKNHKCLTEFYPNIELNSLQVIETPPELSSHKYLSIFSLAICVSSEGY